MSASEESPHQTFERLVKEGGLGTLERLPKNCLATYAYRGNGCEEGMVVPLKFAAEAPSKRWQWNYGLYEGLVVLWMTSLKKFLMYDNRRYDGKKPSNTEKIVRILPDMVRLQTDIRNALTEVDVVPHRRSYQEVVGSLKQKNVSREEFLATRDVSFILEANAHDEIRALLGEEMIETPEKCLADFYYSSGNEDSCLPIQTKSARLSKNGTGTLGYMFSQTTGYASLLLFCRPMRRIYAGTIIIPGALVKTKQLYYTPSDTSKYGAYLVPDSQLLEFTVSIYTAIKCGEHTFKWPSGIKVDITTVKLNTADHISMPFDASSRIERENYLRRQVVLPNLIYQQPRIQGSTIDVKINGVSVQDKTGHQVRQERYCSVTLSKNGGSHKKIPYDEGDYNVLWVHLPACLGYFFVIPEFELVKYGIVKSKVLRGKVGFICHFSDYQPGRIGRPADTWTKKYCFDQSDPNLESKIAAVLESSLLGG